MSVEQRQLAVVGGTVCNSRQGRMAREVGQEIARRGLTLICGGRGGIMAYAAEGAAAAGGVTVGILPGRKASESPPNAWISIALFTGLGQARNQIVVLSADAVVAIGGGWGTLSEIALARKHDVPVVLIDSWDLVSPDGAHDGPLLASEASEAVDLALQAADAGHRAAP